MFLLGMALAATSLPTDQVLAGAAFEQFARKTDRLCQWRHLRTITPGDLSFDQELFQEQLSPTNQRRLNSSNGQNVRCAKLDGLSCPTVETLAAMERTNMLARFSRFACKRHP
jgi:hypothetical protein